MTSNVTIVPVRSLALAWATLAQEQTQTGGPVSPSDLKVFLDCDGEFEEYFQSEVDFVTYVRDRRDADVCVRVTPVLVRGTARHYEVAFIGVGRFEFIEASASLGLPQFRATDSPRQGHTDSAREHHDDSDHRGRRPASAVTP